jgi:SAM-dependent methyltransferase
MNRKRASAKALWAAKLSPCEYSAVIYEAAAPATWSRILEFGANQGGNLEYFLDRHSAVHAVGVDINPVVRQIEAAQPHYRGIVGDESALNAFASGAFDLAFTVSVLDHIPSADVVMDVIGNLMRLAPRVLLLEPWIEGIHGDVSGRTRSQVKAGLENGHKPFAPHSYLWNYDAMLTRLHARYEKHHVPLHKHSLGPFYYLYQIRSNERLAELKPEADVHPRRS